MAGIDDEFNKLVGGKTPQATTTAPATPAPSVAAPAAPAPPAPAQPTPTQQQPPGLFGLFPPASPGPQSWKDWATKTYSPSLSDYGKVFGDAWSYGLSPLALQAAQATGAPSGGVSSDDVRKATQQAYDASGPMGPAVAALGYAASPLTYGVVGPLSRAVGTVGKFGAPIVQRILPRAIESGTTASITAGAKEAGLGGDPVDIFKSAAEAFPVGAGIGGVVGASPLGKSTTQEDVSRITTQDAQAAQAELDRLRFSDPGIKIQGKTPSTEAELQEALKWAQSIKPGQDPGGVGPVIQSRIEKVLNEPGPQHAEQAASNEGQQALNAQTLRRWIETANVPGADVRGQAFKAMDDAQIGSPQFDALKDIASAPTSGGGLPEWVSRLARVGASAGGEAASRYTGIPGGGLYGQMFGEAADMIGSRLARGPPPSALMQERIKSAYPPMTGYSLQQPTGNALQNILNFMAQGANR